MANKRTVIKLLLAPLSLAEKLGLGLLAVMLCLGSLWLFMRSARPETPLAPQPLEMESRLTGEPSVPSPLAEDMPAMTIRELRPRWSYSVEDVDPEADPVVLGNGTIVQHLTCASIIAISIEGQQLYEYSSQDSWGLSLPAAYAADSCVIGDQRSLLLIDQGGIVRDSLALPDWTGLQPVVSEQGDIVMHCKGGTAVCCEKLERIRWSCPTGVSPGRQTPLILGDGVVLMGGRDGEFVRVSAKGQIEELLQLDLEWRSPWILDAHSRPGRSGPVLYAMTFGRLLALDLHGRELWRFEHRRQANGGPGLFPDGTVYTCSDRGYCLNPAGEMLWTKMLPDPDQFRPVLTLPDGGLLLNDGSEMHLLDRFGRRYGGMTGKAGCRFALLPDGGVVMANSHHINTGIEVYDLVDTGISGPQ